VDSSYCQHTGQVLRNQTRVPIPRPPTTKPCDEHPIEEVREQDKLRSTKSDNAQHEGQNQDQNSQKKQASDLSMIRLLQQRIARLEQEKREVFKPRVDEKEASRVQVICTVHCHNRGSPAHFLDKPLEYDNGSDHSFHLHGRKPFPNDADLFVERQRGALSFLIYKELECCKKIASRNQNPESSREDLDVKEPEPTIKESIQVTSKNLHNAIVYMRKHFPAELTHFPEFKVGSTIRSPFLFYYCKRSFMMSLAELPDKHLSQIKLLRQHIEDSFGDEFARVDALITEGNITAQYLAYLFEPGTVVISRRGDAYAGFEQTNWPKLPNHKSQRERETPAEYFDGGKIAPPKSTLHILGQDWHFDGTFSMNWTTLGIDYGNPKPHVKPIKDLDTFPLRFAEGNIEEELRRRGSIFWSCRTRKYVSANSRIDSVEKKVSANASGYDSRHSLKLL
jgi:hypothetical protein